MPSSAALARHPECPPSAADTSDEGQLELALGDDSCEHAAAGAAPEASPATASAPPPAASQPDAARLAAALERLAPPPEERHQHGCQCARCREDRALILQAGLWSCLYEVRG
jgi:hypothetical protein